MNFAMADVKAQKATWWIYDSLTSTNDQAKQLVKYGKLENGSVIFTHEQTCGRGQRNTSWESEKAKSLTFSIVLYPDFLAAEEQFFLNAIVTTGIVEVLEELFPGNNWQVKWPNDIYADDRKLGGILIENTLEGRKIGSSIIGIGLNINQDTFNPGLPNPVSLYQLTGEVFDIKELAEKVTSVIYRWYATLQAKKFEMILEHYTQRLYLLEQWHTFKDEDGMAFRGKIRGVTDQGLLKVEGSSELEELYSFKEIGY